MTLGTMSLIAGLFTLAAAIVLFARRRSIATGLFLFGTLVTPLAFTLAFLTRGTTGYAFFVAVVGPLCAGVGLLWYALTLPRISTAGMQQSAPRTPD